MAGSRERPGLATAPAQLSGVRQMIRALRKGEVVGLLPDQVPPEGLGVWAPFGQPAYTMTLAARLVQQTGAAVLLIWGERLPAGRGYVVHVLPAPDIAPDASPEAAAATVNAAMESLIRRAPASTSGATTATSSHAGWTLGRRPDSLERFSAAARAQAHPADPRQHQQPARGFRAPGRYQQ